MTTETPYIEQENKCTGEQEEVNTEPTIQIKREMDHRLESSIYCETLPNANKELNRDLAIGCNNQSLALMNIKTETDFQVDAFKCESVESIMSPLSYEKSQPGFSHSEYVPQIQVVPLIMKQERATASNDFRYIGAYGGKNTIGSHQYQYIPLDMDIQSGLPINEIEIENNDIKNNISLAPAAKEICLKLTRAVFYEHNFVCDECFVVFPSQNVLNDHKITHNPSSSGNNKNKSVVKQLVCNNCNYGAANVTILNRHELIHSDRKSFECSLCDFKTYDFRELKLHKKMHTGKYPYKCAICDFKCKQPAHLTRHMYVHSGEKPYKCSSCDYRCNHPGSLKRHSFTHSFLKPFHCNKCDYKCNLSSSLKKHALTHSSERPFHCDVCDYKCKDSSSLRKHSVIHTGETPYKCDYCEFKSYQSASLKRHIMVHTDEKPFECDMCLYRCRDKHFLKKHKINVHGAKNPTETLKCDTANE